MKGFINLIKPSGMSSAYAVGRIKKKLNTTCGHMGTLDPMATGVLPVGLGKTSRLFQYLLDKEKTYEAKFIFGYTTDTLDTSGTVTETSSLIPSLRDINSVLSEFTGVIDQIPPKFSAKCINGKRGYQLARQGVDFTLEAKKVTILKLTCNGQTKENEFSFTINCKGGTYIRSLAKDIAERLGTKGVMSELNRTCCGIFNYENGVTVDEFVNSVNPEKYLIPPDEAVSFPKLILNETQATKILNGLYENYGFSDGVYRVYNGNEFWGVGEANDGILKIKSYVR